MRITTNLTYPFVIIVLHTIGAIGLSIPLTRPLFISLTSVNLLVSAWLLFFCHSGDRTSLYRSFVIVYLIGFVVELIGVQTGYPFGQYKYGDALGLKWMDTPLIIGLNWFLLSYCIYQVLKPLPLVPVRLLLGAAAMTFVDFLLEPAAIKLGYWSWSGYTIPVSNYAAWFGVAFVIQTVLDKFLSKSNNSLAGTLLVCQIVFFLWIILV